MNSKPVVTGAHYDKAFEGWAGWNTCIRVEDWEELKEIAAKIALEEGTKAENTSNVKIINDVPDSSKQYTKVCENCAVTLQYVKNDITTRVHRDYAGDSNSHYEIECPKCSYLNDVKQRPLINKPYVWRTP